MRVGRKMKRRGGEEGRRQEGRKEEMSGGKEEGVKKFKEKK